MAQSFHEIVRNDSGLMQLLKIAETHKIDGNGVISLDDFEGTCARITTINTLNPETYSRRVVWTLVGRLLLGLTLYLDITVQITLDETYNLDEQGHKLITIYATTGKRQAKNVATNKKSKKRRIATVEEQNDAAVERSRFWEVPLELDSEELSQPDLNLVSVDKITLRDIEQPTVSDFSYIHDLIENGFGDETVENIGSFNIIDDGNFNDNMIVTSRSSFGFDENMNDILPPGFHDESISHHTELLKSPTQPHTFVRPNTPAPPIDSEPQRAVRKSNVQAHDQNRQENPLTVLAKTPTLAPPKVPTRKKEKRRMVIFKDADDEKVLPGVEMKERIDNVSIDCKSPRADVITKEKLQKLTQNGFFAKPLMRGSVNQKLFERGLKSQTFHFINQTIDWTILQDAFDSGVQDDNGTPASAEIDILRNENNDSRRTRSQSRMSMSFDAPVLTAVLSSTPLQKPPSQRSVNNFHSSQPKAVVPNNISPIASHDVFEPPSPFLDSALSAPNDFKNASQKSASLQEQSSFRHLNDQNAPEIDVDMDENISPVIECRDLATMLGTHSLEYTTMQKLMKLWQQDVHPIKVSQLLTTKCNRIQAAKTFSTLLNLKKKKLVQLENSDDGKIEHISKGDDFALIAEQSI